jgi:hypothetical protein
MLAPVSPQQKSEDAMKVTKLMFALGGAAALTGAAAGIATGITAANGSPSTQALVAHVSQPSPAGPAAADRAAISYAKAHYPGSTAARVLATEPDTERGRAVYDVRVLAPNGAVYVAHVSRAGSSVLWASKAEAQTATRGAASSDKPSHSEADRSGPRAEGDHTPASPAGDG